MIGPGGRLKVLVSGLHMASLALRETPLTTENGITVPSIHDRDEKIRQIRHAFLNRIHLNRPWAYYMGLCEVLNFINVLMQIYLTDWFLGGAFLGLGQAVARNGLDGEVDALDIVFPKVCFPVQCNIKNSIPILHLCFFFFFFVI